MRDPRCSIVVCTDGRAAALAGVLRSLERLDGGPYEVLVVRGPTEDGIADVLRPWEGRIKVLKNPVRNLSASRNLGIAASGGDVVAFVDDDAFPEPEWLVELLAPFADPRVAAAGGIVMDHTGLREQCRHATCNRLGVADATHAAPMDHRCVPGAFDVPFVQGTNSAFRRSDLEAIGGFDEEYEFFHDETDLCCRLVDAGRLVRQLSGAVVHHKMLPSDLRDAARRINRLLPVLKNTLYFALTNGRGHVPPERALESFESLVETYRRALQTRREWGEIDDAVVARFEADVLVARDVGWRRGTSGERRLMAADRAARPSPAFLPLEGPRPRGGRRRLVFALAPAAESGGPRHLPRKALAAAARGHHVHVVAGGAEADDVSFDGGHAAWIHRLASPADAASGGAVAAITREVERIAERRAVDGISVWRPRGEAAPVPSPPPRTRFRGRIVETILPLLGGAREVALTTFPHHWNIGDSAIWQGTLAVLESLGVRVTYVCTHRTYAARDLHRHHPDGPILISGGGNFGDVYEEEAGLRRRVLEDFPDRPVIQLPQSIWIRSTRGGDALRRVVDRHRAFTLLVRDHRSLEAAAQLFAVPATLCPDMALALEGRPRPKDRAVRGIVTVRRRDGEALAPVGAGPSAADVALPDWPRENATARRGRWSPAGLLAWEVIEAWHAAGTAAPIPMRLAIEAASMLAAERTAAGLRLVRRGRAVVTDRLHAALLAWLADRPAVLVDNVYGKNRALAETWFADDPQLLSAASWDEGLALGERLAAEAHDDAAVSR
jgi:exopolysaccharide biosynthesis predicted pyruvyltransferase EpsI/GT2 family glycosyltransferase